VSKSKPKTRKAKPATPAPAKKSTKKGFDLSRDSVYIADPFDLCICGGKDILSDEESGPLDTAPGPDMKVKDLNRLRKPLDPTFAKSVHKRGVRHAIIIGKIDGVPMVIEGKERVRAARISNPKREEEGRPLIRLRCIVQRETDKLAILATIIEGNNQRMDDDLVDRIEKLKAWIADGGSEEDAAMHFRVQHETILGWLAFDDHATDETKQAVREGKIAASSGLEVAKVKDPDRQNAILTKMLSTGSKASRSARAVRALTRGVLDKPTASDRRSQLLLLSYVGAPTSTTARDRQGPPPAVRQGGTRSEEFWRGVRETLVLVTGKGDVESLDPGLRQSLREARLQGEASAAESGEANEASEEMSSEAIDDDREAIGA